MDANANARAAALANPPSPGARKPDGPQQTNSALPLGIFAASEFPPQMNGLVFQTVWIGVGADGGYMKVYTGAIPSEGDRGVVMAFNTDVNRRLNSSTLALYGAPFGVGSLRILSANGNLLSLQASTGETFGFDAQTRELTDANGNPASADTPTPTPRSILSALPTFAPITRLALDGQALAVAGQIVTYQLSYATERQQIGIEFLWHSDNDVTYVSSSMSSGHGQLVSQSDADKKNGQLYWSLSGPSGVLRIDLQVSPDAIGGSLGIACGELGTGVRTCDNTVTTMISAAAVVTTSAP